MTRITRIKRLIACTFFLTFLTTSATIAQKNPFDETPTSDTSETELLIGLTGGIHMDFHGGGGAERPLVDDPGCPVIGTSKGFANNGRTFGVVGQYRFNAWFGIRSTLCFTSHTASGSESLPVSKVLVPNPDDPNGDPVILDQQVTGRGEWRYKYGLIDLLGNFDLAGVGPGRLYARIGAAYGWGSEVTVRVMQTLEGEGEPRFINPSGLPTENEGRTLVLYDHIDQSASPRLALRSGIAYDLPLFGLFHLQPGIMFDYGLTDVETDPEWNMNSLVGQLDILMEL